MDRRDDFEDELDGELDEPPPWRRWVLRGAVAVALLLAGAAGGAIWSERRAASDSAARAKGAVSAQVPEPGASSHGTMAMPAKSPPTDSAAGVKADEAVEVSLTAEAVERAGIKTAVVGSDRTASAITVPGTVMSNAYRDTKVHALVGGIARQVAVELGARVTAGQPLAVVFSHELTEAQMKYLSMRAMLVADHQKRERTQKLVALGAASRQELEEVVAVHEAHETEVAAARQRLLLLGLTGEQVSALRSAAQVVAEVTVTAPSDGVVVGRSVNPGQVMGAGQELFVVTDLSTVWVIGDLYEKDFSRVGVGAPAAVAVPGEPGRVLRGRVAYIDPRVETATRTAKVRVEVPNQDGGLRLGMYVTVSFETGSGEAFTLVPRQAVQSVGERTVVYVSLEEGRFAERTVTLGVVTGDLVQVLGGLKPGERVVTEGSFFLRAEAQKARS